MSPDNAQVIRAWIIDRTTAIIDTDSSLYDTVQEIIEVVGRDAEPLAIGQAICNWISDTLRGRLGDGWAEMVLDVLDLTDSQQAEMFGRHFLED
jgi:hypothetical protein